MYVDYDGAFRLWDKPGGEVLYRNLGTLNLMAIAGIDRPTADVLMKAARDQYCRDERRRAHETTEAGVR